MCQYKTRPPLRCAPLRRCLEDASLANLRCSLRLPAFELALEVPRWPESNFELRWSVLPLLDDSPELAVEVESLAGNLGGEALLVPAKATPMKALQLATRQRVSAGPALGFKLQVGQTTYFMQTFDPVAKQVPHRAKVGEWSIRASNGSFGEARRMIALGKQGAEGINRL